jgi:Mg2+-importing ATPase
VLGPNQLAPAQRRTLALEFLARFRNPLVLLLLVASGMAALTGDVASFVIIVTMVLVSVTLDFVQEHRAGQAAERLKASVALMRRWSVSVAHDVPRRTGRGDVALSAAISPTVRGRGAHLFLNQSLLTGEAYPVEKHPATDGTSNPIPADPTSVFMGTSA